MQHQRLLTYDPQSTQQTNFLSKYDASTGGGGGHYKSHSGNYVQGGRDLSIGVGTGISASNL